MHVSIFVGDIADADAEAVCTSTNPRLSLAMGTGASVRERGGIEILRACEEIVRTAPPAPGSAVVTTAGRLPYKFAIHCVASDAAHQSSEALIRQCVRSALQAAGERECASVAMPVFGSGHAHVRFPRAVTAIAEALRGTKTSVRQLILVVYDGERAEETRATVQKILGTPVTIRRSKNEIEPVATWWNDV